MNRRRIEWIIVFWVTLALYAAGTHPRVFSAGNDASRWAQIEALVDHGRADLGASRFGATVDRVRIGELEFSNKPPALSLAGAAIYAGLQALTGWRLDGPGAGRVVWWVTVLLIGVPSAWLAAAFHRALERFPGLDPVGRRALTIALAAGTLMLTFSVTMNHHTVAAALLFAAFLATAGGRGLRAGLSCGLAAAVDLLPGLGMMPFLLIAVAGEGRGARARAGRFVLGAALGGAVLIASNVAIVGSPWPPKLVPGAVDLSAQAGPSAGGVVLPQSWTYPLECLFGGHGLFLVTPVLLIGVHGLWHAAVRPAERDGRLWRLVGLGVAAQVLGHLLLAGSYGGWSYGFRYLVPVVPLLLFPAAAVLSGWPRRLFWGALPPSILFAALGAFHPWPPAYEQESNRHPVASLVTQPIGGNAAALAARHLPDAAISRWLGERFVSRDPELRRQYFRLFFGSKGDLRSMRRFER